MLNSEIFEIVYWIIIFFAGIMLVFLIASASMLELKEYIKKKIYQKKKRSKRNKKRKKKEKDIKAAPANMQTLMQPEYIVHFESFILLLNEISWPEYPQSSFNKDGVEKSPSRDELENYEEELEEAIDKKDELYNLYTEYLISKNFEISKSELSYVVSLYQKTIEN